MGDSSKKKKRATNNHLSDEFRLYDYSTESVSRSDSKTDSRKGSLKISELLNPSSFDLSARDPNAVYYSNSSAIGSRSTGRNNSISSTPSSTSLYSQSYLAPIGFGSPAESKSELRPDSRLSSDILQNYAASPQASQSPSPPSPSVSPTQTPGSQRKFRCKICSKRYMTAAHLSRHEATHTGARPFECPIPGCGSKFSRSDNRTQHLRTHNNPKGKTSRRMNKIHEKDSFPPGR